MGRELQASVAAGTCPVRLVDRVCGGQCGGGKGKFRGASCCGGLLKMARASLIVQLVKNLPAMQETPV